MSEDEKRRALEREARYSQGLSDLLTCLRDGHVPNDLAWDWPPADIALCDRCGIVYASAHVPGVRHLPDDGCECGHARALHAGASCAGNHGEAACRCRAWELRERRHTTDASDWERYTALRSRQERRLAEAFELGVRSASNDLSERTAGRRLAEAFELGVRSASNDLSERTAGHPEELLQEPLRPAAGERTGEASDPG
jgi:hypothetical protein